MQQSEKLFHKPSNWRTGQNPALRTLFYKLARLLTACVIPVFVFDGPGRPEIKRDRHVRASVEHWMTKPFKKMIAAFGFSSHDVRRVIPQSSVILTDYPFVRHLGKPKLSWQA
jgi:Holliday junction resolvase YEN1